MMYRGHIYYNAEQKVEIWDRWQKGESLDAIGRVFDRPSSSIFNQLCLSGGIRPSPRRPGGRAMENQWRAILWDQI